jgi:hypothetical protein
MVHTHVKNRPYFIPPRLPPQCNTWLIITPFYTFYINSYQDRPEFHWYESSYFADKICWLSVSRVHYSSLCAKQSPLMAFQGLLCALKKLCQNGIFHTICLNIVSIVIELKYLANLHEESADQVEFCLKWQCHPCIPLSRMHHRHSPLFPPRPPEGILTGCLSQT